MNRDWTGKLQVIFRFPLEEIVLARSFWECEGKICERKCVKEFFRKLVGRHLASNFIIN